MVNVKYKKSINSDKKSKCRKINELFNIETGTTPSTRKKEYWSNGNINWFTPADLSKRYNKIGINKSERKITKKALDESNLTLMPEGSIILSTRAPVGYVAILREPAAFNQGCKGLSPKEKNVCTKFYAYYLISKKNKLQNLSSGSTFSELPKKQLEAFQIPFLELKEQRKIAEVLSSVDEGIQKVDEAIRKTERLKQGLMNKLLTKGIGHKEFKNTKIGRIPKKWGVKELSKIADVLSSNVDKKSLPVEKKVRLCNYMDVYNNEFIVGRMGFMKATATEDEIAKFSLKKGDVIITKDSETPRDIAKSAVVKEVIKNLVCGYHLAIIRPKDRTDIDSIFLSKLFSSYEIHKYFVKRAFGMTRFGLSVPAINNALFPVPEINEQRKIAEGLLNLDKKVNLQKKRKEKLVRIKQGLMNDLLTGRKRVKLQ